MTSLDIAPAAGKLGVLTPGMGAVATTFFAGVLAAREGIAQPIGSVSQLGHIRLGKRNRRLDRFHHDEYPHVVEVGSL